MNKKLHGLFFAPLILSCNLQAFEPVSFCLAGAACSIVGSVIYEHLKPLDETKYPLHDAAREQDILTLEKLLKKGAHIDLQKKDTFTTPLIEASKVGNAPNIVYLVNHQAHVNRHDSNGETALIHAVRSKNFAAVQALVSHKASLQARSSNGEHPWQMNTTEPIKRYLEKLAKLDLAGDHAYSSSSEDEEHPYSPHRHRATHAKRKRQAGERTHEPKAKRQRNL